MKKIMLVFSVFFLLMQTVSADQLYKKHDWYFRPNGNNQPILFEDKQFPYKYGAIAMGSPDDKVVYLTYDAGYPSENLIKILDIHKEQNVPAAFFILPAVIDKAPEIIERFVKEGHIVGNHSYSHKDMSAITEKDEFQKELTALEDMYYTITGYEMSKYFRPPEGSFSEQNLIYCFELGYIPTFWSFAYADWDNNSQKNPEWAKKKILDNLHNGMVMLLHPNSATNALIINDIITEIKSRGYRFGTLDELKEYNEGKNSIN